MFGLKASVVTSGAGKGEEVGVGPGMGGMRNVLTRARVEAERMTMRVEIALARRVDPGEKVGGFEVEKRSVKSMSLEQANDAPERAEIWRRCVDFFATRLRPSRSLYVTSGDGNVVGVVDGMACDESIAGCMRVG